MTPPLHDDEQDASGEVARTLLQRQAPELAGLPLTPQSNTGSDNTLYKLGPDLVVRLPRFPDAARRLSVELHWLPLLIDLPVGVPHVVHAGSLDEVYPFRWAVLRWLDGIDAWEARHQHGWFGPSSGSTLPQSSSSCGSPPSSTRLPVSQVSGAGRSAHSTTGCTGGLTKPTGSSTHGRSSSCGISAWKAPTTVWRRFSCTAT